MSETSARIALLERDQVTPEIGAVYDKLLADRGVVPNMFKTLAHTPELALGFAAFLKPMMGNGHLRAWYKEMVATRMAYLNDCEYCMSSHKYLAKLAGASPEQVEGYVDYEQAPYTEQEKAGFRYADTLHATAHGVDDAIYKTARAVFTDEQMIELTAVAAAFEFFPRFVNALAIPVTPLPDSMPSSQAAR
jgi:uncharacterized peroxidase-related enzyme